MKYSTIFAIATFAATGLAAPTNDHVRRSFNHKGHNLDAHIWPSPVNGRFPTGFAPSGTLPPHPNPTGVFPSPPCPTGGFPSPSQPFPTGTAPSGVLPPQGAMPTGITGDLPVCSVDGALVCNGPSEFGLCNWGHVFFMEVADGTACIDGKIVGTGIYAAPTPAATS